MPKYKDLAGQRFGKLTVKNLTQERDKAGCTIWHCKCDCGNFIDVSSNKLKRGNTRSCGCLKDDNSKQYRQSMIGKRFGKLTIVEFAGKNTVRSCYWNCRCDCGNYKIVLTEDLRNGRISDCGHVAKEKRSEWLSKNHKDFFNKRYGKTLVEKTDLANISQTKPNSRNKSGVRGVTYDNSRKKWKATLKLRGENLLNKRFDSELEAIKARRQAEEKYFKPILEKYNYQRKKQ